jgi:transcriptional regulator of acetoin/glycerol metabolism
MAGQCAGVEKHSRARLHSLQRHCHCLKPPAPRFSCAPPEWDGIGPGIADQEAEAIRRSLHKARWNKSRAAELLGISRRTMYRKMQKYGILFSLRLARPLFLIKTNFRIRRYL